MIGIPIGPPSQSPEPKSACMWSSSPIEATSRSESGATGSLSTRWFQGLAAGNTGQAGACASRGAEAEAAPTASSIARARRAAAFLTLARYASGRSAACPIRGQRHERIERSNLVDECGEPVRDCRVLDLEHVLGVELAGVREVEAADERDVVGDSHLGVHEVVHRVGRPLGRGLPGERGALQEPPEHRHLPARVAVQAPLVEDAVDLRVVDDPGDVDSAVGCHLRQRAEDGSGAEHGRRNPYAPLRAPDPLRDPVREVLAVPGREPGPHLDAADVHGPRLDEPGARDVAVLPELLEVELERIGELRRAGDRRPRSPAAPTSRSSSSWSRSRQPPDRGARTCGASGPARPGSLWSRSGAPR